MVAVGLCSTGFGSDDEPPGLMANLGNYAEPALLGLAFHWVKGPARSGTQLPHRNVWQLFRREPWPRGRVCC